MPSRTSTAAPDRLGKAVTALAQIRATIQAVVDRVPGSPAPELKIPASLDDFREARDELRASLFDQDGCHHPDWVAWRRADPHRNVVFEAVYLWVQALDEVEDWNRHRSHSQSRLSAEHDRIRHRLASETITAVLASYPTSAIARLTDEGHRHLIACTSGGEGVYLIRDDSGEIGDFTEQVYEECVRESRTAGLNPVFHVHSRYNLFDTSGVHWTQVPAAPASATPAFVVADNNPTPFAIDDVAFERWIALAESEIEAHIPGRDDEMAASDLAGLIDDAVAADVLTSDPRLELVIDADNYHRGFTLMLRNLIGDQENLAVTTGFSDLAFADSGLSTADAARFHLQEIVEIANSILKLITPRS